MRTLDDPLPCGKRSEILSTGLRERLFQSLAHLFETSLENQVLADNPIKRLTRKILEGLQLNKKMSGLFFALNTLLIKNTAQNDTNHLNQESSTYIDLQKSITELCTMIDVSPIETHAFRFLKFQDSKITENAHKMIKEFILFDPPPNIDIKEPRFAETMSTQALIQSSLNLIQKTYIEFYQEMQQFISEFMILETEIIKGGTSFDLFGIVFFSTNSGFSRIQMAETLIHETSHLYLYALGTEDDLVLNHYDERYYSAIRKKDRPMLGLYHAAFVLIRVLMFLYKVKLGNQINPAEQQQATLLIERYQQMIEETLPLINRFALLTPLGETLIQNSEKIYYQLQYEKFDNAYVSIPG